MGRPVLIPTADPLVWRSAGSEQRGYEATGLCLACYRKTRAGRAKAV